MRRHKQTFFFRIWREFHEKDKMDRSRGHCIAFVGNSTFAWRRHHSVSVNKHFWLQVLSSEIKYCSFKRKQNIKCVLTETLLQVSINLIFIKLRGLKLITLDTIFQKCSKKSNNSSNQELVIERWLLSLLKK